MKMHSFIPTAMLRPFINEYKIIESSEERTNKILPDTCITLAFRFNVPEVKVNGLTKTIPLSVVTGISQSIRFIRYSKGARTLIVLFSEQGAVAFFKQPMHLLLGCQISLDNLLPAALASEIENKLQETESDLEKISIIESFLLGKLANQQIDATIHLAIQQIKKCYGIINIRQLANSLHTSLDPFEKKFRAITGTTPKHFSTILKIRHAIRLHATADNLTDISYQAGYFDQSHLIKDFRRFTGQTPTNFFKSGEFW